MSLAKRLKITAPELASRAEETAIRVAARQQAEQHGGSVDIIDDVLAGSLVRAK